MRDISPREAFAGLPNCPERRQLEAAFDSVVCAIALLVPERCRDHLTLRIFNLAEEVAHEAMDRAEKSRST